jgi:hypothetical protein
MISRFALDPAAFAAFPEDLLDGSRESVRMAERIIREIGVADDGFRPATPLSERLAWALEAMEEDDPASKVSPAPRFVVRD